MSAFLFDHLLPLKPVKYLEDQLHIETVNVEVFIIDAVKTKMVYCNLDQTQRKVAVSHSTQRTSGKQRWQQLHDMLNA